MKIEQLCPRRPNSDVFNLPKTDYWEERNDKYLHCTYCGSLHPDEVLKLIREHGFGIINHSDKNYKWYIDLPSIESLKYYRHHDTQEFIDEYNNLLNDFRAAGKDVETDAWRKRFDPKSFKKE